MAVELAEQKEDGIRKAAYRGAGYILRSALTHEGWKFPYVVLTSVDEHYMADVEVKVKLGHASSKNLLYGLLADFPVQSIMHNVSLISTVLDVVGGSHSTEIGPGGLDSVAAIVWLEGLLETSAAAFTGYLNGSLCCIDSGEAPIPAAGEPAKTLATNITNAIGRMRCPSVGAEDAESKKGLSISGLAFACAAATMPLLCTNDPALLYAVLRILNVSLGLLKEPSNPTGRKTRVEIMRLQHLFNRLSILFEKDTGSQFNLINIFSCLEAGEETLYHTRGAGVFNLLVKLLSLIPEGGLYPHEAQVAKTQLTKVMLCPSTISAVRELCVHAHSITPLLSSQGELGVVWGAFKVLQRSAYESVTRAHELVECAKSLQDASYTEAVDVLLDKVGSAIQVVETYTEEEEPEDFGCITYALGLFLALCASGADPRDSQYSQSMVLVTRILTRATPVFRVECIKQIRGLMEAFLPDWTCELFINFGVAADKLVPLEIQQMLMQPWLVEAVLMGSIYAVNTQGLGTDARANLAEQGFDLLGSILVCLGKEHTERVFASQPAEWTRLLFPLSLLEWGFSEDELRLVPQSVLAFKRLLEVFCFHSESLSEAKDAFYMTHIYGLFHSKDKIRNNCALLLGQEDGTDKDWACDTTYKPWSSVAEGQRTKERYSGRVSGGYQSKVDVMKIAALAFGRGETADVNNIAAARQLRSICADLCVAPAHEPEWCAEVASKALEEVLQLYYLTRKDNGDELVGTYQTSSLKCCIEALLILRALLSRSASVRANVEMNLRTLDENIPFSVLLDLACLSQGNAEDTELVLTTRLLCKQILGVLVSSKMVFDGMAESALVATQEGAKVGFASLRIFDMAASTFTFPESSSDVPHEYSADLSATCAFDGLVFIDLCPLRYDKGISEPVVPVGGLDLSHVKAAATLSLADASLNDIADACCNQIASASEAEAFAVAIDNAVCLMHVIPVSACFFARKDLDVVLHRSTQEAPSTLTDMKIVSKCAIFLKVVLETVHALTGQQTRSEAVQSNDTALGRIVKEMAQRGEAGEVGYLHERVARFVQLGLPTLLKGAVLVSSTMSDKEVMDFETLNGRVRGPRDTATPAFGKAKIEATGQVLALHHALLSHAASSSAAVEVINNEFVSESVQDVCYDKTQSSWQRALALDVTRITYTAAKRPSSQDKGHLSKLVDTARVLRKPDNFQGYSVVVSCMKAIHAGLVSQSLNVNHFCDGDESSEPKWLVRLLYDRRAEVRLITLECAACIPSFRYSKALTEALVALAADNSECTAVTHTALKILLGASFGETKAQIIGQFLVNTEAALGLSNSTVSVHAISMSLSALLKLLLSPKSRGSTFNIVHSLNLEPLIMKVNSRSFQEQLTEMSHKRIQVQLTTAEAAGASYGWANMLQDATGVKDRLAWAACRITGARILQTLEAEDPTRFKLIAERCKFLESSVQCFSNQSFSSIEVPQIADAEAYWLSLNEGESRSYAAMCDVMASCLMTMPEKVAAGRHAANLLGALRGNMSVQAGRVKIVAASKASKGQEATFLRATLGPVLRLLCVAADLAPSSVDLAFLVPTVLGIRSTVLDMAASEADGSVYSRTLSQVGVTLSVLMQNSKANLPPELIQQYFLSLGAAAKEFATMLDADNNRASKSRAVGNTPATRADTTIIRRSMYTLWSSMLVVKSSMYGNGHIPNGLAQAHGLAETLDMLVQRVTALTHCDGVHGGRITLSLLADHPSADQCWTPSFAQLLTVSLATICTFCAENREAKHQVLRGMHASHADERYASDGISHITKLGTIPNMCPGIKLVSLAILSSIMSTAFRSDAAGASVPFISRIAAQIPTHDMDERLEEALKAPPSDDAALEVAHLVEAVGCYAALESVQGEKRSKAFSPRAAHKAKIQPPGASVGDALFYDNRFKPKSAKHVAPETMMDSRQLQRVTDKFGANALVLNSVIRFLGKQGGARMFVLDGCDDLLPRKLLSKATNTDSIELLAKCRDDAHPINAQAASVVLWSLVHGSEQARANFKRSTAIMGSENLSLNGADERVEFGLRALLSA